MVVGVDPVLCSQQTLDAGTRRLLDPVGKDLHPLLRQEVVAVFLRVDIQDQGSAQGYVQDLAAPADPQHREAGHIQRLSEQFQLQLVPLGADLPHRSGGIRSKGERRGVAASGDDEAVQALQIRGSFLTRYDGNDHWGPSRQDHRPDVVICQRLPKLPRSPDVGVYPKSAVFDKISRNANNRFHDSSSILISNN